MSFHAFPRSAAAHDDPVAKTIIPAKGEVDLATLLREARSALQASPIRQLCARRRRQNAALARDIDAYLQRYEPTPLGLATEAAVRLMVMPDSVMMNSGETHVVATIAGVWLRARLLVDWDTILPLLPNYTNASYAPAIAALPEMERAVFLLHRMGGLILRDIAQRIECDVSECERLLGRALAAIARHIDGGQPSDVTV